MAERIDEIITLIESLKRENEISSEDFIERLGDIRSRLDGINGNKEDLNMVVKGLMELVDSKVLVDETKISDLEELLNEIQISVKESANNNDLAEQVKSLSENFKSGFNSVISFANKDADAKNLLLDRLDALEKAVKSGAMIETLRQRTDELVNGYENFISDSNLRHGNMVSALVDLKNKLDDYSSKNNYTFGTIEHSVGETSSKLLELESTVSSNLGNVNSKLYSLGDDIQKILNDGFDHLKYLSSNISEALNSNSIDTKTALECLKANIQDYSQNLNSEIKNLNNEILGKINEIALSNNTDNGESIDILKNIANDYKASVDKLMEDVQASSIQTSSELSELKVIANDYKASVDKLMEDVQTSSVQTSSELSELKVIANDYKASVDKLMEDVQASSVHTSSELSELKMIANDVLPKQSAIDNLSNLISEKLSDYSMSVQDGLSGIKVYIDNVIGEVKALSPTVDDSEVQRKLTELNEQFNNSFTGYEQALSVLSTRLEEYIETAEQVSEESKAQRESARGTVEIIKDKFEEISNKLSNLVGASGLIEILADIRKQFSSVISAGQNNKAEIIGDLKETIEMSLGDFSSRILDLAENISSLQNNIGSVDYSENIEKNLSEIRLDLNNKVNVLQESVNSSIETLKEGFEPLRDSAKVFFGLDIAGNLTSIKEQVELSYVNLLSEIGDKLDRTPSMEKVEDSYRELVSKLDDIENFVKESLQSCVDTVGNELAVVQNIVESNVNSDEGLQELFQSEISRIEAKIDECSGGTRYSIIEQLESIKDLIEKNHDLDQSAIISAITPMLDNEELLNIIRSTNKNLADRVDELRQDDTLAFQEVLDVISSVKNTVEYTLEVINDKFENANGNAASIIQNIEIVSEKLDDISEMFSKKDLSNDISDVNDGINEIKTLLQQISLSSNILESYEQTLKVLDSKLDVIAMNDNSEALSINFQQIKDSVKDVHKAFSSDSPLYETIKTVNTKLDLLAQNDNSDITDRVDEVKADISDLKLSLNESEARLDKFVKTIDSKIDVFVQSTADDGSAITDLINEGVDELKGDINSSASNINQRVENVENGLNNLNSNVENGLNNINSNIENGINSINSNIEKGLKLEDLINELNSKVDILAMSDNSDILDEIYEIRTLVETQINDSSFKSSVEDSLQKIVDEIDKVDANVSEIDFSKRTEEIKDAVIAAIVSVTSEISFVEETEELKDFVSEKTTDIHRTLMDVKHQLSTITNSSGDMDLYTYTLQDVESDLAKLRMTVNEIAHRAPENELSVISSNVNKMSKAMEDLRQAVVGSENIFSSEENLNEQILSISTRLNKLLLIQEDLDGKMQSQLESDSYADNIGNAQRIEELLHSLDQRLESSFETITVLKNVMGYLGEWMDSTTETLSGIYNKCNSQDVVKELKEVLPDNTNIIGAMEDKLKQQEAKIKELSDIVEARIEQQDSRLDRIENQLDRICEILESQNDEHSDNARLDSIESKLKSLSTNIEKLASYVD